MIGLIVYAIVSTVLPTWILRLPPPEFDAPTVPEVPSLPADLQLAIETTGGLPPGATGRAGSHAAEDEEPASQEEVPR